MTFGGPPILGGPARSEGNGLSCATTNAISNHATASADRGLEKDSLVLDMINQLQTDLVHSRMREAEMAEALRSVKERLRQLDEVSW
ncbi:unnamed protein product [Protopolystoma xenopodis]|uniref:Uncharacterized protein n=1 Tax=Protopolystoma xenopodis TaxID=117903 RepID=A0A3S5FE66_9PLAT|nr:unnamed protein product [Protopolystoma xenopodis]